LLSTTVFYKDIVSQVIPVSSLIPLTVTVNNPDGTTSNAQQTWTSSSLVNGPGIGVTGAEFSYQQNFDFLPKPLDGLGFLGNYTYLQSHGVQVADVAIHVVLVVVLFVRTLAYLPDVGV